MRAKRRSELDAHSGRAGRQASRTHASEHLELCDRSCGDDAGDKERVLSPYDDDGDDDRCFSEVVFVGEHREVMRLIGRRQPGDDELRARSTPTHVRRS